MNYRYHIVPSSLSLPASEGTRNSKIIKTPLGLAYTLYRYLIYGKTGAIDVRHQMLTSAPSSIGMLTSAVNRHHVKRLRAPKLMKFFEICAEVHPCRSSVTRV